jgi:hypothetical protein
MKMEDLSMFRKAVFASALLTASRGLGGAAIAGAKTAPNNPINPPQTHQRALYNHAVPQQQNGLAPGSRCGNPIK